MSNWQALTNQPNFNASTMLLLTDGTVMCQESGGKNWWRLTPDGMGDYANGSWSPLAAMKNTRLYYASAVMRDGRVFVAGGEYSDGGSDVDAAEIYDPIMNNWTSIATPAGWTNIGDAPCCVLPDGRILLGSINQKATAIYDPQAGTWSASANKDDISSEETWTLLPDGTVLTAECAGHPKAEKYVTSQSKWVSASSTPVDLVQASSIEIGPAILMPDGKVFAIGATGHTAIYTPPNVADQPGSWKQGPDFPKDANGKLMEAKDAPACLMPNGRVLCVAGPAGEGGSYPGPMSFFEFDGSALNPVAAPSSSGGPPFVGRMLLLPSGQVLFAVGGNQMHVYTSTGQPQAAWRPHITSCPTHLHDGLVYQLHGRQLNGLSQANSYGDDASMATNYPLVKLTTAGGKVHFCRTFDHSTMAVATGSNIESTYFAVPFGTPIGKAHLTVIANGIESAPVVVTVERFQFRIPINEAMVNILIGSLADGPLWVLTRNGPVPVDPWGPDLAAQAQKVRTQIAQGVRELEKLGVQLEAQLGNIKAIPASAPVASGQRRRLRREAA